MALQIGYHKIHESGIGFCTRDFEDNATRITLEITFALEKLEKKLSKFDFRWGAPIWKRLLPARECP